MKIMHLDKTYSNPSAPVHALKDVSIDFIHSGIVFIMGESGSGKSTLLRILAGADPDYTGTIEIEEPPYYVSSDYDLFNELTVMENLLLTRATQRRINKLIDHFNLSDLVRKKAKLLSNGEKRRIQLIKAILMNKKIILLDETVNALDYENLIAVMDLLKAFSHNHLIVIVTHNDTLIDRYADQIIRLSDGHIVENQLLHTNNDDNSHSRSTKSKIIQHKKDLRRSLFAYTRELFGYKISMIFLAILTVITSSITISLFTSANSSANSKYIIETNNATLTAVPLTKADSTRNRYYVYSTTYKEFNSFYYQDILNLIQQYPQIVAINPFYSFKYNTTFTPSNDADAVAHIRDQKRYSENYPSFLGMVSSGEFVDTDFIVSETYYMDEQNCFLFSCSENRLYAETTSQVINNKVNVFTLVNDYSSVIHLLYGDYGNQPNEVVIDYSLAEKLLKSFQLESMEQLLNHEFVLNIVRQSNAYSIERDYTEMSNLITDIEALDEQYIHDPYESVSFIITGITEFNNESENNAYLTGSILENPLLANFLLDTDHSYLPFSTINIMVNPSQDMETLKKEFNTFFHLDQSEFKLLSETQMIEEIEESYQVNTPIIVISSLISLISLFALGFDVIRNKAKVNVSIALLDRMNYKRGYVYISQSIEFVIIVLFSFGITMFLQTYLNQFSLEFNMAQLMQSNYLLLFVIATLVCWLPLCVTRFYNKS